MFLALALLLCPCEHPLAALRLTSDQMFQLQLPYRYHVRVITFVKRPGADLSEPFELAVDDYYANDVVPELIEAPQDARFPQGSVRAVQLRMDDGVFFENDRYHCFDRLTRQEYRSVLFIADRKEKKIVWPQLPEPDP